MGLIAIFLLGIGNFAIHRAVLESGHRLLSDATFLKSPAGGRITLAFEFAILLATMLLVEHGRTGWGWAYAIYSAANFLGGWLILTRRI